MYITYIYAYIYIYVYNRFTTFWAALSAFINEKTKQKIIICGSRYQDELFKYVDPSQGNSRSYTYIIMYTKCMYIYISLYNPTVPAIWGGTGPDLGSSPAEIKMGRLQDIYVPHVHNY